ncbi:Glutathione S-transferase Mu 4 [Chamberlinius hualienensis]
MATTTFAYFNVRGLGHPIRLLLTYVGEKYQEKVYQITGAPPNVDKSDWFKEKYSHNLDFPNLPYYIDGKLYDLRNNFLILCRGPDFDQQKVNYLKNLAPNVKQIDSFLGSRKYFAGDKLTYVDFLAYEYFYQQQKLQPGLLNDHQNLITFYKDFEAIPQLSKYIQTAEASNYVPTPRFRLLNQN